jgi:hypothetical protein
MQRALLTLLRDHPPRRQDGSPQAEENRLLCGPDHAHHPECGPKTGPDLAVERVERRALRERDAGGGGHGGRGGDGTTGVGGVTYTAMNLPRWRWDLAVGLVAGQAPATPFRAWS